MESDVCVLVVEKRGSKGAFAQFADGKAVMPAVGTAGAGVVLYEFPFGFHSLFHARVLTAKQ
jgi:hypothetical protein